MKQYIVNVKPKHKTSLFIDIKKIEESFPIILEGKNRQEVKEAAETIIRDLGIYPEEFIYTIEIGC